MAKLKVLLCGQKAFGAAVLRMLRERADLHLSGVYAPAGDKLATLAKMYDIPVYPAGTLRSDTMPAADLVIAAHSHDFISQAVRNRLPIGAIGYHPSLLPLHRGRDAVRWTIRDHDQVAGGTVFWLNDTVDGGPVAAQDWCFVRPDDTASTLWRRELFPMGIRLIAKVLDDIVHGRLVMHDQDTVFATWEPSFAGAPRLLRPELKQIGMLKEGYKIIK